MYLSLIVIFNKNIFLFSYFLWIVFFSSKLFILLFNDFFLYIYIYLYFISLFIEEYSYLKTRHEAGKQYELCKEIVGLHIMFIHTPSLTFQKSSPGETVLCFYRSILLHSTLGWTKTKPILLSMNKWGKTQCFLLFANYAF